jgi:hypothetical protein
VPSYRTGTVTNIISERAGLQRVEVDGEPSYVLTQLIGDVAVGDRVVVNTTAVALGLGTGGWHVVHWNLSRDEWSQPGRGHVMKLRYTSLQADTGVTEEDGPIPDGLEGTPVVALALHSQLACAAAAVKARDESLRVVYVMTDGGALPLVLSDLLADLLDQGVVDATVTTGHAFGGDLEAVNVRTGLALAKWHLDADVVFAGMGPGSVGTGSFLGFSGLEVASALDAAGDSGGEAIAALRVSDADERLRHRGVSTHSKAAIGLTHVPVMLPVPAGCRDFPWLDAMGTVVEVTVPDAVGYLAARGITPTTMGRTPADDPRAFSFAAAAGAYAQSRVRDH